MIEKIQIHKRHNLFAESLRALYLADNDFEYLPPEVGKLKNLQIVSTRAQNVEKMSGASHVTFRLDSTSVQQQ